MKKIVLILLVLFGSAVFAQTENTPVLTDSVIQNSYIVKDMPKDVDTVVTAVKDGFNFVKNDYKKLETKEFIEKYKPIYYRTDLSSGKFFTRGATKQNTKYYY